MILDREQEQYALVMVCADAVGSWLHPGMPLRRLVDDGQQSIKLI